MCIRDRSYAEGDNAKPAHMTANYRLPTHAEVTAGIVSFCELYEQNDIINADEMTKISLTVENLPHTFARQKYFVAHTCRVTPVRLTDSKAPCLPAASLPINIIEINLENLPSSHYEASRIICNNFDISLCCITLKLDNELKFQFYEYNDAVLAIRERKLRLLSPAFGCGIYCTRQSILKYVKRDFTW